jgi:hypothetical protein
VIKKESLIQPFIILSRPLSFKVCKDAEEKQFTELTDDAVKITGKKKSAFNGPIPWYTIFDPV